MEYYNRQKKQATNHGPRSDVMDTSEKCAVAFKEWAVVCAALAAGKQVIILRKGGIHEGPSGFQPEYDRFWLYPTRFHQGSDALVPDAEAFLNAALAAQPAVGAVRLQHFARVQEVIALSSEDAALALEGQHIWSQETVRQRFYYRRPGLFALLVRVYQSSIIHELVEAPEFIGCKTWVLLPEPLSLETPQPVLSDQTFAARAAEVRIALS
jgi:hypothetical protein